MARIVTTTAQGEISVLSVATSKSKSLRATVPIGIIRQLGLKEGDQLLWELKPEKDQLVVIVKPMRGGQKAGKGS